MKTYIIGECYHNKFHPNLPQCKKRLVYHATTKVGNLTDSWTWCKKHLPANGEKGAKA